MTITHPIPDGMEVDSIRAEDVKPGMWIAHHGVLHRVTGCSMRLEDEITKVTLGSAGGTIGTFALLSWLPRVIVPDGDRVASQQKMIELLSAECDRQRNEATAAKAGATAARRAMEEEQEAHQRTQEEHARTLGTVGRIRHHMQAAGLLDGTRPLSEAVEAALTRGPWQAELERKQATIAALEEQITDLTRQLSLSGQHAASLERHVEDLRGMVRRRDAKIRRDSGRVVIEIDGRVLGYGLKD